MVLTTNTVWQIIGDMGFWPFILKVSLHFLSSGCAGWLAYYLTPITPSQHFSEDTGIPISTKDASSIRWHSLWLALACAIYVHVMEDYVLNWF